MKRKTSYRVVNNVRDKEKDRSIKAKPLGKRKSASGLTYYEYRLNRADKNRKLRF